MDVVVDWLLSGFLGISVLILILLVVGIGSVWLIVYAIQYMGGNHDNKPFYTSADLSSREVRLSFSIPIGLVFFAIALPVLLTTNYSMNRDEAWEYFMQENEDILAETLSVNFEDDKIHYDKMEEITPLTFEVLDDISAEEIIDLLHAEGIENITSDVWIGLNTVDGQGHYIPTGESYYYDFDSFNKELLNENNVFMYADHFNVPDRAGYYEEEGE